MIDNQEFASVWDVLASSPEQAENLKIRSHLLRSIQSTVRSKGLNQTEIAQLLGITQPMVSKLLSGRINAFSLDALVNYSAKAGLHISIQVVE